MRVKSIAVFLIVLVLMILFSLWQVDSAFYSEQTTQGEGAARSQLASIVPALQAEYRSLGEHVKLLASQTVDRNVSEFSDVVSYRVEMISRIHPTETGEFIFDSKSFHEKTPVRNWAENYTTVALKALKPKDVAADGAALVALADPQRKPFFLWIFRDVKERWTAVITKPNVLQGLMDRQKGLYGTVMVVNQQGQVLGHTTSEYIGTSMAEDPLISELIKSGRRNSSGFYKESNGKLAQGYFEIVPTSNTYVALSRPMAGLQRSRESIRWQLILLGGGFLFVGLAAFVYVQRGEGSGPSWKTPRPPVAPTPGLNPTPAPAAAKAKESEGSDLLKERMKAYTTSASALARELHGPISRIMALTKVLGGQTLANNQKQEVQEIEELARDGRAILRKLLSFAGEEEYQVGPTGMIESVNRAMSGLETKLNSKGIKVEKNLKRVSEVAGNSVGLAKALEAILMNAIESMERMPNKKITLDLEGTDQWVTLKIRDSGEGISAENLEKVFDPFFSLKNRSIHSGLGLSMAIGVIHEFGGEIHLASELGKGTLAEVRLPVHPNGAKVGAEAAVDLDDKTVSIQPAPTGSSATPGLRPLTPPATLPAKAPPTKPSPPKGAPSLLQDKIIEETFAAIDELPALSAKPSAKAPPPPPPRGGDDIGEMEQFVEKKLTEKSQPPPIRGNEHTLSVKIDRPQIGIKPPPPKLPGLEVSIRKPGEKPPPPGGRR